MALWMEAGSEPRTESEIADLDAITALKESAALELKDKGNEYVKKGRKHYSDAIDCYTRAINQKVLSDSDTSTLYANRAHVNLLLGNYRRALSDSEEAIRLCPTNIKAYYRAVKASLSLNLLEEAKSHCKNGLKKDPDNEELKKLDQKIDSQILEDEKREAEISDALATAKRLISALEERKLKIGKAMYRELTGLKKPTLDRNNILHWPVLFLYAEVMSSDFVEDFCETDMFLVHLDTIFSEPLPRDKDNNYTRDAVELYYEAGSEVTLSKYRILRHFLEGTAAANVDLEGDEESAAASNQTLSIGNNSCKWVKVNERRTLHDVLREPNLIIPGIPAFFVVSKTSSFYQIFKSGKWTPGFRHNYAT
ncbi:hypothetical protein SAY86_029768 [Trapa natans]|uniref:Cns1/TTC4 wheel domain-containing protein n=1 Tax=Trapa natans TaxID=22666 RepID=A0AAN7M3Y6_TRANT|nr:hypothetical protein SAY86_029768 [Trapa natans]